MPIAERRGAVDGDVGVEVGNGGIEVLKCCIGYGTLQYKGSKGSGGAMGLQSCGK